MLQSMALQRVGYDVATEQQQQNIRLTLSVCLCLKFSSFFLFPYTHRASLVAQMVKRLPAMRESRVRSLGWEDPLGMEMETHSSTLAWKIPWIEEPGGLQSKGFQRVGHN